MIEVKNVTKRFGDFTAVENISFTSEDSGILGLVGYNGAGKTTLLKTAAGIYKPEEGAVLLDGENVYENAKRKKKLFYVPDDIYFLPYASMDKMASFYKGYFPDFSDKTFKNLAELFGLDTKKRIAGFSKGMQRQAELSLAFAAHPDYLLMDESFDGIDPQKRTLIKDVLLEYQSTSKVSVIISSHNLHETEGLCDRIVLLNKHKVVVNGDTDSLGDDYSKFSAVFENGISQDEIDALNVNAPVLNGKLLTFTALGNAKEAEEKLRALSPESIERIPMALEEIFLEEMEEEKDDLSQLFA